MATKPTQNEIENFCRSARDGNIKDVTAALDKYGQDIINCVDMLKDTALTWAVWCGQYDIVVLLLKRGADINIPERCDRTPLHCAVQTDKPKIAALLLQQNPAPNLNARDKDGRTPLMLAEGFKRHVIIDMIKKHAEEAVKRRRAEQDRKLAELHQAKIDKLLRDQPRKTPFKPKPPRP